MEIVPHTPPPPTPPPGARSLSHIINTRTGRREDFGVDGGDISVDNSVGDDSEASEVNESEVSEGEGDEGEGDEGEGDEGEGDGGEGDEGEGGEGEGDICEGDDACYYCRQENMQCIIRNPKTTCDRCKKKNLHCIVTNDLTALISGTKRSRSPQRHILGVKEEPATKRFKGGSAKHPNVSSSSLSTTRTAAGRPHKANRRIIPIPYSPSRLSSDEVATALEECVTLLRSTQGLFNQIQTRIDTVEAKLKNVLQGGTSIVSVRDLGVEENSSEKEARKGESEAKAKGKGKGKGKGKHKGKGRG
ncbi:hypothetical protein JAAARDRAFT_200322 [Jaapia argillacea MUCL 33604]|uniref:Zn(2)-C6 fungal-type domain-containing protein n=1 Tax=Jaapia argillacea MUCL 33604 TaxID=933084 RepID=A0A067P5N5_9AGAM|nr:hypothetical protein JAAARDRAFT_200322 [Jaapia argillacea MUCL 33604]